MTMLQMWIALRAFRLALVFVAAYSAVRIWMEVGG